MAPIGLWLETEIGITGGEEDGVGNTGADNASLYSLRTFMTYTRPPVRSDPTLSLRLPGNIKLLVDLPGKHPAYTEEKLDNKGSKPMYVVSFDFFSVDTRLNGTCSYLIFHGGSPSSTEEISTAVGHGVIKMNVDSDTQFVYLVGIRVCVFFSLP